MGWCNIQSKWKRRKISLELKAKTTLQHAYATYHYHDDDKDNDDTASDVTVAKDDDCFQHMLKLTEVYYMQSPVSRNNWHSLHWNCSFVGYLSVRPYVCLNDDCPHPRFNGRFMQYTRQSLCKTWKPPEHSTFVGWRNGSMAGYLTGICRNWCGARRNLPHGILPGLHFVFITFLYIYVFWSVQLNSVSFAAVATTAFTWKTSWPPQVRFLEDMLSHKIGHEIVNLFFFPYLHKAKTKS